MKTKSWSFFKRNVFTFGDQKVTQFVLFEWKYLFSIIFFYFHKSEGAQDRYHTHAFNALSVKLFGRYTEYKLWDEKTGVYTTEVRKSIFKYFPRDSYHKIGNSTGCLTMLLSGPWNDSWKEYINGRVQYYSWGRNLN